jgi:prolyl-tRNA editing enzyme YbaK/EbsC (Cys-tRNA(Pro) deacylase)
MQDPLKSTIDNLYVQRLDEWLQASGIQYEFIEPGKPMPTVPLAAAAIGVSENEILKSLLFADRNGNVALVIACGPSRIDLNALERASGLERPRMARPNVVLERTGFPAGGVAPIGHATAFPIFIDRAVMHLEVGYGGGGSEALLLRLQPVDIARLTGATIVDLTSAKDSSSS